MRGWQVLLALALAAAGPAHPPPTVPPPAVPPPAVSAAEVVVRGRRPPSPAGLETSVVRVRRFAAARADDELAMWRSQVCPAVVGPDRAVDARIVNHIAAAARAIGLKADTPGCHPNIIIVLTDDPQGVLKHLLHKQDKFAGAASPDEVRDTLKGERPVYWWRTAVTRTVDGRFGGAALRYQDSLITAPFREDLAVVLAVVDTRRLQGLSPDGIDGYLAMGSLAQVRDGADLEGADSVMRLFAAQAAGEPPPTGLTDWDYGYLAALYRLDPATSASVQRYEIAEALEGRGPPARGAAPATAGPRPPAPPTPAARR